MEGDPQQQLCQALSELRAYLPRAPASHAELFHMAVQCAAPGPQPDSEQKVPARAASIAAAFLRLLQAVQTASRDEQPGSDAAAARSSADGSVGEPAHAQSAGHVAQPDTGQPPRPGSSGAGPLDPCNILAAATLPLLLFCGAHIHDKPWTNSHSRFLAKRLLQTLVAMSGYPSAAELLKGVQAQFTLFKEALGVLGPRLRKDTWESHPDAKVAFYWMLRLVPRPWLTDFLSRVMPPSLLFSDDYKPDNKVLGVLCLHHIIKNVPAADLRQYNRAMVVYHALRNHLYTTEPDVIMVALRCLIDLFPVIRKPPPALGNFRKDMHNPSDEVMKLVLTHMEMESKIPLRRIYAYNLCDLQESLGLGVVRHLKRLLTVIVGYLDVYSGPEESERLFILKTLQGTIKYAWCRMPSKLPLLLKSLLKLIHDVSADPSQYSQTAREALLKEATECLILLDCCCKGQVKTALEEIPSICNQPDLVKCINKVLQHTEEQPK